MVSSVDAVFFSNVNSKFTALGYSEETLFISFSKGVTGILSDRPCLEKDTNECSCLVCDSSCCRTSCVSVQPCTPKVLPNTETFLHSRVFFVTCVVPAICQIMYELEVCSDGPPARTLSLTKCVKKKIVSDFLFASDPFFSGKIRILSHDSRVFQQTVTMNGFKALPVSTSNTIPKGQNTEAPQKVNKLRQPVEKGPRISKEFIEKHRLTTLTYSV